jgi:hypothetical protein
MKNERKFKEYMTVLGELFDKSISELLMFTYWKILEPFDDDSCKKAFEAVTATAKFFPKPADFLEILSGRREEQAARAWIEVVTAVRRIGNYQSVKFSNPMIHSVVQAMGGWPEFCMMKSKDETWRQREFERLYAVISAHPGKHPEYLPGTCEIQNSANGFEVKPQIVKIGFNDRTGQSQIAHNDQ